MECAEKGILSESELDGVGLAFGKPEGMMETVKLLNNTLGLGVSFWEQY